MIFFDDWTGNTDEVSRMGVYCVHCPRGLTSEIWSIGIASFADLQSNIADGAPPGRGAAAGQQQRNAPDILLGGLDNLSKDPLGWCFGPPSPLYSNAGAAPAAGPPAAGFQPPTAGGGASQAYAAESAPAPEATRDGEEEAAKAAWLAKQNWPRSGQ